MTFTAPLRLRLDSDALIANWKTMAALSGAAATGAAVKANAYGLGAREVVQRLWQAGCREYFVAHWGEAEALADLVPARSISVLNGICEADVASAIKLGAIPVLNTPRQIALWKAAKGTTCHVMLDSGINRLGLGPEQVSTELLSGLEIDILMSHLASADEDVSQNHEQLQRFVQMASAVSANRKSLANSAGITLGQGYCFDLTRPGLSLYGGVPTTDLSGSIRRVVFPEARVLQMRQIKAGEKIGYNATRVALDDMRIATIAIGYADGYFRGFSNAGYALFENRRLPVVGRVSMDLVIVDATDQEDLDEGCFVGIEYELPQAAKASGMSQYELMTGLASRSERLWE